MVCSPLGCVWIPDYSHGITLATPLAGSEKKQVLHFCALGSDEMQKFVEDLKESIAEVTELEQIRIECKNKFQFLRQTEGVRKGRGSQHTHLPLPPGNCHACSALA